MCIKHTLLLRTTLQSRALVSSIGKEGFRYTLFKFLFYTFVLIKEIFGLLTLTKPRWIMVTSVFCLTVQVNLLSEVFFPAVTLFSPSIAAVVLHLFYQGRYDMELVGLETFWHISITCVRFEPTPFFGVLLPWSKACQNDAARPPKDWTDWSGNVISISLYLVGAGLVFV